ncbi:hypothetical protein RhiJN_01692 [Ceratobasidium sp. AG-Ba]|nr:hypothetical protein RhiJN_01692 [Ceratobasidium sp. AG-Ba]QRW02618.1 hypothetical protein RhiLY_01617 [Ceratobasidium sp. AG-Ba]
MPATDPPNQQAARSIKMALRDAWFMALPKRIQRSAQLIETAQLESRVLLKHVRAEWSRSQKLEQDREARLAKARTQPCDIECLRAPDPAAWHGLGRRKKRCHVQPAPSDTFLLHPSSCYVPKRSSMRPGLRDSVRNVPGLIYTANGPANPADYGLPTPASTILAVPEAAVIPPRVPSPAFPYDPAPGEFSVHGHEIDPDLAYIVAFGHHSQAPEAGYSAARAAVDIYSLEHCFPDALAYLERLLFPDGSGHYSTMSRPWDDLNYNLITGLPESEGFDAILTVVDQMTQMTDRLAEELNQVVEIYLCHYVAYKQDNWVGILPMAEFAYNHSVNSSTNQNLPILEYLAST